MLKITKTIEILRNVQQHSGPHTGDDEMPFVAKIFDDCSLESIHGFFNLAECLKFAGEKLESFEPCVIDDIKA